jgi:hypothetical protein
MEGLGLIERDRYIAAERDSRGRIRLFWAPPPQNATPNLLKSHRCQPRWPHDQRGFAALSSFCIEYTFRLVVRSMIWYI